MVKVTDRLNIYGVGLTKRGKRTRVKFGNVWLDVDPDTLTSEHIEADLGAVDLTVQKDNLLEIKRSRRDYGCPSHLVTVVPAADAKNVVFVTSAPYLGDLVSEATDLELGFDGTGLGAGDAICQYHAGMA